MSEPYRPAVNYPPEPPGPSRRRLVVALVASGLLIEHIVMVTVTLSEHVVIGSSTWVATALVVLMLAVVISAAREYGQMEGVQKQHVVWLRTIGGPAPEFPGHKKEHCVVCEEFRPTQANARRGS